MTRKLFLFIFFILMISTLTSCWDRQELNEIAIAVGMGFDGEEDNIQVTIQVVNPGEVASNKSGGGYSTPISVFSTSEATTHEALRKLTTKTPRKIFSSHLRILVISEKVARKGIADLLDILSRDHEIRSDFNIIVARDTSAKNVLSILAAIEKIPANRMFITLEMSEKLWAPTTTVDLDQLINDIYSPSKEAVLTRIKIIGDAEIGKTLKNLERSESYANLQYSGISIFRNDKLVDWLTEEESKGYNYIMNNIDTTVGHMKCPHGGILGVEITRANSSIKGSVHHGKPEINLSFFLEEDISEVKCKIDLTDLETIETLEKAAESDIKRLVKSAIRKAKKNKSDIFGFGEAIEDASPQAWTKLKDDWDQEFADLDVTIQADVKIRRLGSTTNSILDREE